MKNHQKNYMNIVRETTSSIKVATEFANATVIKTYETVASAVERVNTIIEDKKLLAEQNKLEEESYALNLLEGTSAERFVNLLEASPITLTKNKVKQIKEAFPIPREQYILWADAEFDLRPSGIVITNKGVFIKTNAIIFGNNKQEVNNDIVQKSELFFYSWNDFDSSWFISELKTENKALLVDSKCSQSFINTCRIYSSRGELDQSRLVELDTIDIVSDTTLSLAGITAGSAIESSHIALFAEHKSSINTPAGHGEMAEEAINMLDKLHGLDAKVVGRDNAKNGADRQIGDILIQTKYYNSARGSLEACFDSKTGQYRYMNDGKPMQLEVPKDQYDRVLNGFKKKIEKGKVPGVIDPNEASNIVKKGRLTYQQAVNLTKPGTIESLSYDALTGVVTCTCSMGITFVATVYLTWRRTGDLAQAIQTGTTAGLQIFGISFIQHMMVSQLARTGLANTLLAPSNYIVTQLGNQTSATLVNGIRVLSGKGVIYGAAASKHLAKILRNNAITSFLSFAAFSIPETYNVVSRKISSAQYIKNISVLIGSIASGAGGAVGAGIVAAKVAGAAGTTVAPGVGTAIGIVGGFVGGTVGSKVVKTVGDVVHEDDVVTLGRLFNAYVSCMIGEYLLDEVEIDKLITFLNNVNQKELKVLFENLEKSNSQECIIRDFLVPFFETILEEREYFALPSPDNVINAMSSLITLDEITI